MLDSWEGIFNGQQAGFEIACHGARVISVEGVHLVLCYEQLPGGWLVANNSFVLEDGEPRLFHHQASPCADPPEITPQAVQ